MSDLSTTSESGYKSNLHVEKMEGYVDNPGSMNRGQHATVWVKLYPLCLSPAQPSRTNRSRPGHKQYHGTQHFGQNPKQKREEVKNVQEGQCIR